MSEPPGVALVTGASRGLGATIASHLAAHDWAVAVNYRSSAEAATRLVDDIRARGHRAEAYAGDVTAENAVPQLIEKVAEELGPIAVLVVNATGPQPDVAIEELTWQTYLDQLAFFVKSPTLLVQAVLPAMKAMGGGRIIQIGSDSVGRALPSCSAYVAAKAAQLALTRTWARELGRFNITVNLVAPGWIPVERHADVPSTHLQRYAAEVPLRRTGTPDDVAAAVCFLASDAASFITGEQVTVNGGHTLS
jgi:3-oxoacyl-[acyl-carrier protein] reductase